MSATKTIIAEVESALRSASDDKRIAVLRRVTDLFVDEGVNYTAEQTAVFGGLLDHLIDHIERRAAVELSLRLARTANAPAETVRKLARHDDIEIAGPVLEKSHHLTDDDLIEIAETKGNAHMLKMTARAELKERVTDVLVSRGDADVANGLAVNTGARFSGIGMAQLVMRADGDERLTESVGRRHDLPPRQFRQLLSQATGVVRNRLLAAAPPEQQEIIKQVLIDIAAQVAPSAIVSKRQASQALRAMRAFRQDSRLLKSKIVDYAKLRRPAEVIAGLSVLIATPFEHIDRLFQSANGFGLMVLCKTLALDWQPARELLLIGQTDEEHLVELQLQYATLSVPSAQRLFRFWAGRQNAAKPVAAASRTAMGSGGPLMVA